AGTIIAASAAATAARAAAAATCTTTAARRRTAASASLGDEIGVKRDVPRAQRCLLGAGAAAAGSCCRGRGARAAPVNAVANDKRRHVLTDRIGKLIDQAGQVIA